MNDLEYVIWFLLNQKKFEIEFRLTGEHTAVVLKHFAEGELHQILKVKTTTRADQKMHEFIMMTAMELESALSFAGIREIGK